MKLVTIEQFLIELPKIHDHFAKQTAELYTYRQFTREFCLNITVIVKTIFSTFLRAF